MEFAAVIQKLLALLGISLILAMESPAAEIKYVTDDLQLALHEKQGSKGSLLKRLPSGTRLEVLEESGMYARVKTPDGVEGWTKSGFLMTSKPASARLLELEQTLESTTGKLESHQARLAQLNQTIKALKAEKIQMALEMSGLKENDDSRSDLVKSLSQEIVSLKSKVRPGEESLPLHWVLYALPAVLIIGVFLGFYLFDWRSRRRHGGYRIY
jgi:SH3 domain protein